MLLYHIQLPICHTQFLFIYKKDTIYTKLIHTSIWLWFLFKIQVHMERHKGLWISHVLYADE